MLCYDIRDDRRLRRVHRLMKGWGVPFQYSLFLCQLTRREARSMMEQVRQLIDVRVDDVRLYTLDSARTIRHVGRPCVPEAAAESDGLWVVG